MVRKLMSGLAVLGVALGLASPAEAKKTKEECKSIKPEHELKMVTLAPAGSEWSKQFAKWSDDALEETDCKVLLKWYFNAPNEPGILDDLRSGAKHGAAMTATGLAAINKNILLLQLPGVFANWGELDAAREKAKTDLEGAFKSSGFIIAGWGDTGAGKILSTDAPVRTPKDLTGKGVFHLQGDLIGPKFLSKLQGATPKPLSLTELSTHLGKDVQVVTTSPFAAEQLQLAPKFNHITLITPAFGVGALVFKKEKLEALGPELTATLLKTGKVYGDALTQRIRQFDADAFARMKQNKNKVELTPAEVAEWESVFKATRQALKGEFDANLYAKIIPASKQ